MGLKQLKETTEGTTALGRTRGQIEKWNSMTALQILNMGETSEMSDLHSGRVCVRERVVGVRICVLAYY